MNKEVGAEVQANRLLDKQKKEDYLCYNIYILFVRSITPIPCWNLNLIRIVKAMVTHKCVHAYYIVS